MKVERKERGWPGHFICANSCIFRRNTLLSTDKYNIVVSTVGNMFKHGSNEREIDTIGYDRYYETMVFHSKEGCKYNDADVTHEIHFNSNWCLNTKDSDLEADEMHENVVKELTTRLEAGELFEKEDAYI